MSLVCSWLNNTVNAVCSFRNFLITSCAHEESTRPLYHIASEKKLGGGGGDLGNRPRGGFLNVQLVTENLHCRLENNCHIMVCLTSKYMKAALRTFIYMYSSLILMVIIHLCVVGMCGCIYM